MVVRRVLDEQLQLHGTQLRRGFLWTLELNFRVLHSLTEDKEMTKFNVIQKKTELFGHPPTGKLMEKPQFVPISGKCKRKLFKKWRWGTTRPAHYHVLLDEIGFSADELQELVHNLSYVYQRSTTVISIVAPVAYAHLAATQISTFTKFDEMSENSSSHGGMSSVVSAPVPELPRLNENV